MEKGYNQKNQGKISVKCNFFRLLQQWICRPLCDVQKLTERQKAVAELLENAEILKETRAVLKKLPDLERQVAK